VRIEDGFSELDFGDWEGVDIQSIWDTQKDEIELLYIDPIKFHPPNGETMPDFEQRVLSAWRQTLETFRGKHLLLIQHGGTIRIMLTHLLSTSLNSMARFDVSYGCFIRFHIYHNDDGDKPVLMFFEGSSSS